MPLKHLVPLLLCLVMLAACSKARQDIQPLTTGAVVLVVGDSLVAGTGARAGQSWPEALARRSGWSVINGGIPGDTSEAALRRLPALIEAHRPDAVIIAVGGNDFLRRIPSASTRSHLTEMTRLGTAATAYVAIMGVPAISLTGAMLGGLSDHELFAEIAEANGVVLISDVIADTLSRPEYRSDRIHANADGYAYMAARIYEVLAREGWVADGPAP